MHISSTYRPQNQLLPQGNLAATASYTFSAKEKDSETGLSYFGARYYSSDLSIWLSVDPMSGKYPSLSPYVYCANNPVKLVDPNGEDYEVVVDHEKKTITICATYYAAKTNASMLEKALEAWNEQSDRYTYTLCDKEVAYTIKFNLSAKYFNSDKEAVIALPASRSSFNIFSKRDLSSEQIRGRCDGINIEVDLSAPLRTIIHEIGHSLGIGEGTTDVMISGGDSPHIQEEHIMSCLNRAGLATRSEYNCNVPNVKNDAKIPVFYKMNGYLNIK